MTIPATTTGTISTSAGISVRGFRAKEGCQAHLVIDRSGAEALLIDPRLDQVDELLEAARSSGAALRYVLDTHTHADHLSGVRRIAGKTGAQILAHPGSKVAGALQLEDGATFPLGESTVAVIYSPGHTPDSLSLLVDGHLFTGDALFAGSAGRTDFMGGSASALYDSFRRFETLPEDTVVHPGHDYVGRPTTTIGTERRENALMKETDRERLVAQLDAKGKLPANMKTMLAFNTRGPSAETVSPLELDALMRLSPPVRIIDVRSPGDFASRHLDTAVNIPLGELNLRVGELNAGPDGEIVLLCRAGIRSREAARILATGGVPARQLDGGILAWTQLGLPVVGGGRMPVEQQVQLTVGTMVLAGVALGTILSPWFLVIPAFFGAGLLFAGATGTCGLGILLGKMPWNRRRPEDLDAGGDGAASACQATTAESD
jgi:glyoxylase-like metal-dependent hydrolase (beta-lactamase superfamily II)